MLIGKDKNPPHAPSSFDATKVDPRVRLAMRILEFEQTEPPGGADLAQRVGMSEFHFARLFAATLGEASASYGRRIRLDHVVNRLRYDPAPLAEVAAAFGYTNAAAFSRAFSRQFGVSPRRYLENSRQNGPTGHPTVPNAAVQVVHKEPVAAVARRFFGSDWSSAWRKFLDDLPKELASRPLVGMTYDDPRVTPERHRRYDCVVLLQDSAQAADLARSTAGLDAIEAPGGVHAELHVAEGLAGIGDAVRALFADWLPRHHAYQPEGDPIVHRLLGDPRDGTIEAVATIRLHVRHAQPSPNLLPLDRRGRPASIK